jgi:hypothetical protein
VRWDSVTILNGVTLNLAHYPYRIFLGKGRYSELTTIYGTINPSDFLKLKHLFDMYVPSDQLSPDEGNVAGYALENVRIILHRNHPSGICYLHIQRKE